MDNVLNSLLTLQHHPNDICMMCTDLILYQETLNASRHNYNEF